MFKKYSDTFLQNFDLNEIVSKFREKDFVSFEQNSFIFSENDPVTNIFFILSGKVEIRKSSKIRTESLYCIGEGGLIGIGDSLTGDTHSNSAYVLEKASTLSVHKNDFLNILETCEELRSWTLKYLSTRSSCLE